VDKEKPLAEIAAEEVQEECGFNVSASDLERVSTFRYIFLFSVQFMAMNYNFSYGMAVVLISKQYSLNLKGKTSKSPSVSETLLCFAAKLNS